MASTPGRARLGRLLLLFIAAQLALGIASAPTLLPAIQRTLCLLALYLITPVFLHWLFSHTPVTWEVSEDGLQLVNQRSLWGFRRLYPWSALHRWSETPAAFFLSVAVPLPASISWMYHPRLGLEDLRYMPVMLPKRVLTPAQTERVRTFLQLIRPPEP